MCLIVANFYIILGYGTQTELSGQAHERKDMNLLF